jgi:hypothetical protein
VGRVIISKPTECPLIGVDSKCQVESTRPRVQTPVPLKIKQRQMSSRSGKYVKFKGLREVRN